LPLQWSATDDTIIPAGTKIYIAATITVTMYYTREVDGAPRHTSGEDYIVYVLKTEAGQNFGIAADRPFTLPQDAYRDENGVFQGMANLQITSVTPGGVLRVPCFTRGTMIDTPDGPVAVEKLRVGDLVMTRDNGAQPLRWVGGRSLSLLDLLASPNLRPVRIAKGSLGDGLPTADLCVSPQHRVLVRSVIAQRMFGTHEVLIAAKHLIGIDGIRFDRTARGVDYFHLMFDAHQVVVSNGAPSESLYLGPEMLKILGNAARAEILALFPEVTEVDFIFPAARPLSNGRKGRQLVERHARNRQPLFA
ncbi:MAG: Hint domain-containing protein, partial [Paracoccus sp. (in: a-proteobacteria)]|nr:Hint domain-containing protein [Paracoccus sp. (in: a-proteobacteria)]